MDSSFTKVKSEPIKMQGNPLKSNNNDLWDPLGDIMQLFQSNPSIASKAFSPDSLKDIDTSKWQNFQPNPQQQNASIPTKETSESLISSVASTMASTGAHKLLTGINPALASMPIVTAGIQMLPQAIGWLMKLYDQKVISDMYDIDTEEGRARIVNAISNFKVSGHNAMFSENMGEQINQNIMGLQASGRNIEFARALEFRGG